MDNRITQIVLRKLTDKPAVGFVNSEVLLVHRIELHEGLVSAMLLHVCSKFTGVSEPQQLDLCRNAK